MGSNEAGISIIMPLYNAEKYLEETLQSLCRQTYSDFEVICVNDGSTDGTMMILQQFQKTDKRIRILENTEQSGAAVSRNRGIYAARGKYVTFLDGDDVFEEEMLESAHKAMERYDVDIAIYESIHVSSEHIYEKRSIPRSEQFVERYCRRSFSIREHEPIEYTDWTDAPWNKLYRKDFICSNRLEFQTLPSSNDVYFVNMALLLAEKIIMLNDRRVMVYARDHYESTRISYNRDPMCVYLAMEKVGQELTARGLFEDVSEHYYFRLFYALRGAITKTKKEEAARKFYLFLQEEGIEKLTGICEECYQKADRYIYHLLENFKKLDFSTGWYKQQHPIVFYLDRNAERIISLFHSFESCGEEVAWWGVGVKGRVCLDFLQQHGLQVSIVVDQDENKWGKTINGYVIRKPEEVLTSVQAVMVCTLAVYQEVAAELNGVGIRVINIEDYCMV